jgi:hypothetical protein
LGENALAQLTATVSAPAAVVAPPGSEVAADAVLARDFEHALIAHTAQTMMVNLVIQRGMYPPGGGGLVARSGYSPARVTRALSPTLSSRHLGLDVADSPTHRARR